MKKVEDIVKELFPHWSWDEKYEECGDIQKIAVTFGKALLDHLMAHDNEYIYVSHEYIDDSALFDYDAMDELKKNLI